MTTVKTIPRILVLLATYQGEPWLREQLASILAQEDVHTDILIGDDASRDGTCPLIATTYPDTDRVRLCKWAKGSGSAGANFRRLYLEANLSSYDYVALADQDDIWMPQKLSSAVALLGSLDGHGYSCAVEAFWPDGRTKVLAQNAVLRSADFLFEGAGQGCTFVVRPEFFRRVQDFCRAYPLQSEALHYHDWLIYVLARAWNLRWCFDSRALIRYRQHGGNEIGSRGGLSAITKRLGMIRNGWYRKQVEAAIAIYRCAGGSSARASEVSETILGKRTPGSRVRLLAQVVSSGRRRLVDRGVLALAVVARWL